MKAYSLPRAIGRSLRATFDRLRSAVHAVRRGILNLGGPAFGSVILFAFGGALLLAAHGLEDLADLRDQRAEVRSNSHAASPIAYGERIVPLMMSSAYTVEKNPPELSLFLRVDSLPSRNAVTSVCNSFADIERWVVTRPDVSLRYVARTAPTFRCTQWSLLDTAVSALVSPDSSAVSPSQWNSMRWAIVDGAGRALYSRAASPTVEQVATVLSVLRANSAEGVVGVAP